MKLKNKFYVASSKIRGTDTDGWTKATEAQAVEHAKALLEKSPGLSPIFISKIVKVVETPAITFRVESVQ